MRAPLDGDARRRLVRRIAFRMPRELRILRGRAMLEDACGTLGVEDVPCPACSATGWLDALKLERCPVCCGFREVPDELAAWFKCRLASGHVAPPGPPGEEDAAGRPRPAERWGRTAEVLYRVHLPEDV